jgi:predicted O-linked N-acetylglucosamine transferase (SPINDLY family)
MKHLGPSIPEKREVMALCQQNQLAEAQLLCERICEAAPGDAGAWFLLGAIFGALGNYRRAEECCRRSAAIAPKSAETHRNLAVALGYQGKFQAAVSSLEDAISLKPDYPEALYDLGTAHKILGSHQKAMECYQRSLAVSPEYVRAYAGLSALHYTRGEYEIAQDYDDRMIRATGSSGAKIRRAISVPPISQSNNEIDNFRNRVDRELGGLLQESLVVHDPVAEIDRTTFLLAYHGRNVRDLHIKFARTCLHACPSLSYEAPHCRTRRPWDRSRKIRVGFISKYFTSHSIARTSRGIIANLSRDRFDVWSLYVGVTEDEMSKSIRTHSDHWIVLPENLAHARRIIEQCELDVLFYQDIGMEPFTYFLAFSRLAPVQCTSFGHPVTTGIPNMDYFVSVETYEQPHSQDHYSEKLHLLRDVASCAYYYRPALPSPLKPRAYFGIPDDRTLYICPQTLFKFHPDFDEILAGILRRDPDGQIILINGAYPEWTARLRHRFEKTIPDVLSRVQFVPQQIGPDFINLIAVCDVMLDTIYFCGQNTSHEGFSAGIPIVTLPGEFMRSRHTLGFYRKMGFMDCVANSPAEYVGIAVRLGTDTQYRNEVREKIRCSGHLIWEELQVVREFERFFEGAVNGSA